MTSEEERTTDCRTGGRNPSRQPAGAGGGSFHGIQESALFELYVQSVTDYAMFLLDAEGFVQTWNAGAARIKGYDAAEIIGRHFSVFYPAEDIERGKPLRALRTARATGRYEDEGWRVRKDGSRFWASVVINPVYKDGELIGFAKVTRDLSERQEAQEREGALLQRFRSAEEQVDTQTQLNAALRQLNEDHRVLREAAEARVRELEELDRLKDDLLAMLGHDLKSPLTSMKGFTQLMLRALASGAADLKQLTQGLTVVHSQVARMTGLLDDLLEASRIRAGIVDLRPLPSNLLDCLSTVRDVLDPEDQRRLQIIAADPMPAGTWDRPKIRQVLANLIGNALKYSPAGEPVSVTVGRREGQIEVAIRDGGMGIPSDELPHLFERFYRTPEAKASGQSGTGLGLFICKGIIEAHGGRISAESPGPGRGSTFRFTLPCLPS